MPLSPFRLEDEYINIFDPEEKRLIRTCKTFKEASYFTGILVSSLRDAVASKKKRFSPFLNKELAFRYINKKKVIK